jgi:hypothetical protein
VFDFERRLDADCARHDALAPSKSTEPAVGHAWAPLRGAAPFGAELRARVRAISFVGARVFARADCSQG